jgi:hypothetical protein
MKIFTYDNGKLLLDKEEILLVREFEELSTLCKKQDVLFEAFKYIFLWEDWRSPYSEFSDIEKKEAIAKDVSLSEAIQKKAEDCRVVYKNILYSNPKIALIKDISTSIKNFRDYFKNFNMHEKVESGAKKGQLLYSAEEYLKVVKQSNIIFEQIEFLEKTLKEELQKEKNKYRGNQDRGEEFDI